MSVFSRPSLRDGLWSNPDFVNFWTAETVASFGFQISAVVVPLIAAVTLNASPFEMGLLGAASQSPRLAIGFPAGAWVDRRRRRPIMVAMASGRVLSTALIPLAALTGHLSFWVLLVSALLGGTMSVIFDAAWSAVIPNIVESRQLTDATSKLMGSASLAQVVGPAIGGFLVGWIGGSTALWITAAGYAACAWFLTRIRRQERVAPRSDGDTPSMWRDVQEGLHELWRSDIVRPLLTSSVVLNFGGFIFLSVYVLYMTHDLGLSERGVGFVFASGGVGALIGAVVAPRVADMLGVGRSILLGSVGFGAASLLVPLTFYWESAALPLIVAAEFLAWMMLMIFNTNRFALRQALTPDRLRGRVGASQMTIIGTAVMFGNLVGGVIGDVYSVHTALWVGVVLMFLAAWWVWDSPVPAIVTMPEAPEDVA